MQKSVSIPAHKLETMDTRLLVGLGLAEAQKRDPRLAVLYADVGKRFGLDDFRRRGGYCLDTGIAEQNMLGVAAGFCAEGIPTVVITYGPFLAGRAFDQIRANVGEMEIPLVLVGSPSGLSAGGLGPLSTCIDDIALLRAVPGMHIVSPADALETLKCFAAAVQLGKPVYIRMTGKTMAPVYQEEYAFEIGKAVPLRTGERVAVVTTGAITARVLAAADRLAAERRPVAVLNMHTVKPLDTDALQKFMGFDTMVTVEEHNLCGGLGDAVASYLASQPRHPRLVRIGIPDCFYMADGYEALLARAGLTEMQIYHALDAQYQID